MHMLAFKELLWNTRALIRVSNNLSHFMTYGLTSLVCEVFTRVRLYSEGSGCLASRSHVDRHVLVGLNERPVHTRCDVTKAKLHIEGLNVRVIFCGWSRGLV